MHDPEARGLKPMPPPVSADQLTLFAQVLSVMAERGIPCWIDQGSLLGAIREGAFFSWDHDIDLGTSTPLAKLDDVILELAARGAHIEVHPYVLKLRRDRGEKIIDLRLYHVEGDRATAELASTPSGPRSFFFSLGLRWSKKWQRRAAKLLCLVAPPPDAVGDHLGARWRRHLALLILWRFLVPAGFFRNRFRSRRVFFEVDAAFFRTLRPLSIYGLPVHAPSNTEAYLAMKYGADWRRPNPDWIYWRDDGALVRR
jgi:hypothetical protein